MMQVGGGRVARSAAVLEIQCAECACGHSFLFQTPFFCIIFIFLNLLCKIFYYYVKKFLFFLFFYTNTIKIFNYTNFFNYVKICQFMPICKIKFDQHRVKNVIISWSIKLTTALSSTVEFCAKSFHNDCSVYVYCLLSIVYVYVYVYCLLSCL